MGWARLDDNWHEHPKTIEAGLEAAGLWAMCLTWAHKHRKQTAGVVPVSVVERLGGRKARTLARRLVQVGYFDELTEAGWPIHDFADFLPKYSSEQAAAAGSKGGRAKRNGSKPLGEPPPEPHGGLPSEPPPEPYDEPPHDLEATRVDAPASTRRNPEPVPIGGQERSTAAAESNARTRDAAAAAIDQLQAACSALGMPVRWDKLTPDQRQHVADLAATHGVDRLAQAARTQWRPDNPAGWANAWLGHWDALPPPGRRLAAVPEMCPDPAHARQPMPCRLCAADRKAAG